MAISFVGSYVGTHAATTQQTINFSNLRNESNAQPTLLEGDMVFVAVENSSTVDRTQAQLTPNGYMALHTDNYQNDSNDSNLLVSVKIMGATPDASVVLQASNATTAGVAYAIYVFRGVNPVTPMDVTPVVTGAINTGVANANAITPATPGAWIVAFAGAAVAAGAVFTNPAGMSSTTNHFRSATITTTTNDANIAGAIYTGWTSGSYDPAAFGGSTTTNTGSWSAVTLALRPILDPVTGDLASTEGSDSFAATGDIVSQGSLAVSESGADGFSATGAVTDGASTGTLAATESADSFAGSGDVYVKGSLTASEGADSFASTGKVVVKGVLAVTEAGQDSAAASGRVIIKGGLAVTETGVDAFAAGSSPSATGDLAGNENADELRAHGHVRNNGLHSSNKGKGRSRGRQSFFPDEFDQPAEQPAQIEVAAKPAVVVQRQTIVDLAQSVAIATVKVEQAKATHQAAREQARAVNTLRAYRAALVELNASKARERSHIDRMKRDDEAIMLWG